MPSWMVKAISLLGLASTASALQLYSDSICASIVCLSSKLCADLRNLHVLSVRCSPVTVTSEVTYCSTGRAVEVERFDIRYYR